MYGKFEEKNGLINHCIDIYDKMVDFANSNRKYFLFKLSVAKIAELLGLIHTRPIFEKGLKVLNEDEKFNWGINFIET